MAEGDPKIGQTDSWRGDLISISTKEDPMPTLYHTDTSYYSQIVRLVLEEEGVQYKSRHFDIHSSMEQLNSWYLNINPNGNVPTLIYQGKPIVESKDISLFVVKEISNEGRLLLKNTKETERQQQVLELMELHFNKCAIEQLSMGALIASNKLMSFVMPKKVKSALENLKKMKTEQPELEAIIDKKIQQYEERMEMFSNPIKAKEESLGPIQEVLDQLEQRLNGNDFICGPDYSLADCLYTCLLARLSMIDLLKEQIANRPNLANWWGKVQVRPSFKSAGIVAQGIMGTMAKKFCTIL